MVKQCSSIRSLAGHVDAADFAKATKIMNLLHSPLSIATFMPKKCPGVKIKTTFLRTKETMPKVLKLPPHNVNPKIWDLAKKILFYHFKFKYT
jgi:hypothetical protein